jgi:RND family efflux transporter MFP subunit
MAGSCWAGADDREPGAPGACDPLPGFVAPFRTATLGVALTGRITRLPVDEGQTVRAGELLFGLADEVQQVRADAARLKAESDLEVELARVRMEHAEHEFQRTTKLRGDSLASSKELADARSGAETARIEHALALRQREESRLDWALQERLLDQLSTRAPFDGYVSKRLKQLGETVEVGEGVIKLVQLDPLIVVLDCHLTFAHMIHQGDRLRVQPADSQWSAREGTVVFACAAADAASQMIRMKLLVANADGDWIGGMKVYIQPGAAGHVCDHTSRTPALAQTAPTHD